MSRQKRIDAGFALKHAQTGYMVDWVLLFGISIAVIIAIESGQFFS